MTPSAPARSTFRGFLFFRFTAMRTCRTFDKLIATIPARRGEEGARLRLGETTLPMR